jgi:hypothetical protein
MIGWWRASDLDIGFPNLTLWEDAAGFHDLTALGGQTVNPEISLISAGIQGVKFTLNENYMSAGATLWSGAAPRTMIAVWKSANTTSDEAICGQASATGSDAQMFGILQVSTHSPYLGGYNHDIDSGHTEDGSLQAAFATYDGGSTNASGALISNKYSTPAIFNTPVGTFTDPLDTSNTDFEVGHDSGIFFTCESYIAEIICYNRVLSAGEITTVKAYITNKFGITFA